MRSFARESDSAHDEVPVFQIHRTSARNQDAELLARALSETRYHHLPGGRKKLDALVRLVSSLRPARILDVGCGNGGLALPLAALGYDVVAADVDPTSIAHCRARNRFAHASFVHTDGTLREIDGGFDLIVCSEVLEHLEDPDPLIEAMSGRLSPRGRLFITIPNGYGLREIGGRVERWLRRTIGLGRPLAALRNWLGRHGMISEKEKYATYTSNPEQDHVQKFSRPGILRRLRRHGLDVADWQNSFFILSIFHTRSGLSSIERLDSWAADHLPAALASGWHIECTRARVSTEGPTDSR